MNARRAHLREGTLAKLIPSAPKIEVSSNRKQIPLYAADGTSLGFRTMEAAGRLIASGYVKPTYGRKGHLKAIWLLQHDGGSPIETRARPATRYSFVENLETGRCWTLRRLDGRSCDGTCLYTRSVFLQVLADCLVP